MKIYYAHPISWYGSAVEQEDISTLLSAYSHATVVNPGHKHYSNRAAFLKRMGHNAMPYFYKVQEDCDLIAFRSFDDGKIGAGVAGEILNAVALGQAVLEITDEGLVPFLSLTFDRILTVEETRERVRNGQR